MLQTCLKELENEDILALLIGSFFYFHHWTLLSLLIKLIWPKSLENSWFLDTLFFGLLFFQVLPVPYCYHTFYSSLRKEKNILFHDKRAHFRLFSKYLQNWKFLHHCTSVLHYKGEVTLDKIEEEFYFHSYSPSFIKSFY